MVQLQLGRLLIIPTHPLIFIPRNYLDSVLFVESLFTPVLDNLVDLRQAADNIRPTHITGTLATEGAFFELTAGLHAIRVGHGETATVETQTHDDTGGVYIVAS